MIHFDFPGPNIALHKPTQQSSVDNSRSDKGVDGRRGNEFTPECVYTAWHYDDWAWWRVDLGAEYTVTGVKMYTHGEGCM